MNPPCARCKKTVYPVEKLNCLDKIWHKGCFKCESCGMTLNMKNYKGYNKLPYCNAHYPTTKFTATADTPENMRLKKNTQQQSGVVYHKDFEESKGMYAAATEDKRAANVASSQPSNIAYQGQMHPTSVPAQDQRSQPPPQQSYQPPPQQHQQAPPPQQQPAPPPPSSSGPKYAAIYDYSAADEDEVSFVEGDNIINVEVIDEGWMQGTVERTGQTGMLPSNYVELN